jgi:hypothetical protein
VVGEVEERNQVELLPKLGWQSDLVVGEVEERNQVEP